MTFVEGRLWTAAKSEPGRFLIYDREGRFVESRESPVDTTIGLAYDGAGRLLILTSAQLLLSTPVDDISLIDHVDLLRPFDFEGFQCQDIAFMPGCYGGQLWVWCERTQTSEYYLARMWLRSDGSLSLAESFPLRCGRFPSLAHDGRNVLWGGSEIMYAWFALDDGIDQPSWLIVDPMGGSIVPQGDEDVYLTFDAYGRQPGRYEAALHFLTNEPNGADAEITATMVVRDGRTVPDADLPVPLPVTLLLEANFPNPFNDRTTFRYALPQPGAVALELFDGRGGLAKQVNAGLHAAGCHTVTLSCQDLPSGAYWARLTSGGISRVVEVQVVK